MIKVVGTKNRRQLTVEYNNGVFLFDGMKNEKLEEELRRLLLENTNIADWYIYIPKNPEDPEDPANIYDVLVESLFFFDEYGMTIETDEELNGYKASLWERIRDKFLDLIGHPIIY